MAKLGLYSVALGTSWQQLVAPTPCNCIELTADVNWEWRTGTAARFVNAGTREALVDVAYRPDPQPFVSPAPVTRFSQDEVVCEIKGATSGNIWIKCVR